MAAVKQANADMEQARQIVEDTALALYAGDDNLLRPFAEIGGAGGICVSSHLAGEQMRHMYEAARAGDQDHARAIDDELQDIYATLFLTASPAPVKAALNLLGFDVGGAPAPDRGPDGRGARRRCRRCSTRTGMGVPACQGSAELQAGCEYSRSAGWARSART